MPRKGRFYLPGVPAHVVQRGNCRQAVFFCDDDYAAYLGWLEEGAIRYGCKIHAYVLMTNHVHLLMTPETRDAISRTIQHVGRCYVTYVNSQYGKSGTLWEGRHKGCVVSSDEYLLACMRYIELNPVRAGMVASPGEYRWSSYHFNAGISEGGVIKQYDLYLALGQQKEERAFVYRELFRNALAADQIHALRATVQTGTPLGNERFRQQIEQVVSCRVGQARRGRPSKGES
ncbi:MAG: transposase [Gammaproteobacteria bacterium]|nr:transposase [Gammaproteobacteria bacterium]